MGTIKLLSPRRSLSSRFVLATCVMLLPLLAVAEGSLLSMDRAFDKVQTVLHETAGEGILNLEAQTAMLRASEAMDHYIVGRAPRQQLSGSLMEADKAFARLLVLDFDGAGEREKIEEAQREWWQARNLGKRSLLLSPPLPSPLAARLEADFERHVRLALIDLRKSVGTMSANFAEQQAAANAARVTATHVIIFTAALGFLAALACAVALARSVLAPLTALEEGARRLGQGELSYRVTVGSQDEMGGLARTFNEMGTRLNAGQDSLREANLQLEERIAEAGRMQEAQYASEERFRLAATNASDLIYEWDIAHDTLLWLGCIDAQLGYEPGTFPHTMEAWEALIHHDDHDRIMASIQYHLQHESKFFEEYRVYRKDGAVLYWTDRATIIRDEQGKAVKWIGATSDITESKQAQAALQHSEMRLRALVESIDEVVFEFDGEGTYLNVWSDNEALLAQPKAELIGRTITDVLGEELGRPFMESIQQVMSVGRADSLEYSIPLPDGDRWFLARISPIFSADGVCRSVCMLARDITERKDAETALGLMRDELEARVEERTSALALANRDLQGEIKERENAEAETRIRARQQETVAELGRRALTDIDMDTLLMGATALVTATLDVEICSVLELTPDRDSFLVRASTGLERNIVGNSISSNLNSQAGYVLRSSGPVIVHDLRTETRFERSAFLLKEGIVSGMTVVVGAEDSPFGTLGAHTSRQREFTQDDVNFLQSMSNVLAAALERRVIEREVRDLNKQLQVTNERLRIENLDRQKALGALREAMVANEQATNEAQEARKIAEVANLAKSEFLSRMSHELRTPLNAILGFGQIINKQDLNPRATESIGHILKAGRHLLDLINEVLDISRVEAGGLELSLEPISLGDIVPEACSLVRPLAAERHVRIRLVQYAAELAPIHVLADGQRLKQVLINLLSNAIKYNREGGQVTVSCERMADDSVAIAVRDTGEGILPTDLPKLFTPFERLGAATAEIEGTGLGLALSQRLVTAMGGDLEVESILGQGSVFTVKLSHVNSPQEQLALLPEAAQRLAASEEPERTYTVLCIEDNLSNLRLIEVIFELRPEITLLSAMQGSVGLDLARLHEPDVILLDLNLPDISGREVLERLRQFPATKDIPVIVVSADATPAQIERLLAAGATAYLTKPLDVAEFQRVFDLVLQNTFDPSGDPAQHA